MCCKKYTDCNPAALVGGDAEAPATPKREPMVRCPCRTCRGWVVKVEEYPNVFFWGCGECGNVWRDRSKLDEDISKIVKKYKYRRKSYVKLDDGWGPEPQDQEVRNYEERVESEWDKP